MQQSCQTERNYCLVSAKIPSTKSLDKNDTIQPIHQIQQIQSQHDDDDNLRPNELKRHFTFWDLLGIGVCLYEIMLE